MARETSPGMGREGGRSGFGLSDERMIELRRVKRMVTSVLPGSAGITRSGA